MGERRSSMMLRCLALLLLATVLNAVEFTPENWDELTAGKNVFVAFISARCHHCKALKPAWEKLTAEYEGSPDVVFGEADCMGAGKSLCTANFVNGFPRLMHGNPHNLVRYENYDKDARSYEVLKAVVEEKIKPRCTPRDLDRCTPDERTAMEAAQALEPAELSTAISALEEQLAAADEVYKTGKDGMTNGYTTSFFANEKAMKASDKKLAATAIGLMIESSKIADPKAYVGPGCSVANLDDCGAAALKELAGLKMLPATELQPLIKAHEEEMTKTKATMDEQTKQLQIGLHAQAKPIDEAKQEAYVTVKKDLAPLKQVATWRQYALAASEASAEPQADPAGHDKAEL